jgi:ribonuclease VapC
MIIDSSAILAILRAEPDMDVYNRAIEKARDIKISAATYLEVAILVDRGADPVLSRRLDQLLAEANAILEPFTDAQARIARTAYRDFGKGSGHRAKLNFGDCFSYALAKDSDQPLLFKGNDFLHTDIESAVPMRED